MVFLPPESLIHISPISRRESILCNSGTELGILKTDQIPNGNYEPELIDQKLSSRIYFYLNKYYFRKVWFDDHAYLLSPNSEIKSVDIWVNTEMVFVKEHNSLKMAMKACGEDYSFQESYYSNKLVKVRLLSNFEKMRLYEG